MSEAYGIAALAFGGLGLVGAVVQIVIPRRIDLRPLLGGFVGLVGLMAALGALSTWESTFSRAADVVAEAPDVVMAAIGEFGRGAAAGALAAALIVLSGIGAWRRKQVTA